MLAAVLCCDLNLVQKMCFTGEILPCLIPYAPSVGNLTYDKLLGYLDYTTIETGIKNVWLC